MSRIAGIDVGGTFTDLIVVDDATGEVRIAKVPTTAPNQAFGVLAALDAAGVDPGQLDAIVHGTTTTTNAMLERKIATVGLITTRGFRDVLELGRRTRPTPYGLKGRFVPLIERRFRLEVDERVDSVLRIGDREGLAQRVFADHARESVAAQEVAIAGACLTNRQVRFGVRATVQYAKDHRALRMRRNVGLVELALVDEVLHQRVVVGDLRELAVAQQVGAGIPDVLALGWVRVAFKLLYPRRNSFTAV